VLPAICDVSVTNVCNAACDFCGFARDKNLAGPRRYIDPAGFSRALPILRRRRIRYMTLQGGEPLVHPVVRGDLSGAIGSLLQRGVAHSLWSLTAEHYPRLALRSLRRRAGQDAAATHSRQE
jgi:2-iminoacetate synthase ThiH